MGFRIAQVYEYYPVYADTVAGFYIHGFKEDEGALFVTMANANFPGRPPAVSLELGPVAQHVDGTIARIFTLRGAPVDNQSAPWGIAVVYGVVED